MDKTQLFLLVLLSFSLVSKVIFSFCLHILSSHGIHYLLIIHLLLQTEGGLVENILGWVGLGVEVDVEVDIGGKEPVVEAEEESEEVPAEAEDPAVDEELQDESIEEPEDILETSKPPVDEL